MAHPVPPDRPLSVEEYLAFEETSRTKHELVDGRMYAMSGVTRRHSRILGNVFARLWAAARGGPCRVHAQDVKLRVGEIVYYPDVMVACGPELDDERLEDAPCLAIEVTSPSTARTDRSEKLRVYRTIPALRTYLVVDQERRLVDRHWRDEAGEWRHDALSGSTSIVLPCPALTLALDEIYEEVAFASGPGPRRVREPETAAW